MATQLILGKPVAQAVRDNVREQISQRVAQDKIRPGLAVVLVGQDPRLACVCKAQT